MSVSLSTCSFTEYNILQRQKSAQPGELKSGLIAKRSQFIVLDFNPSEMDVNCFNKPSTPMYRTGTDDLNKIICITSKVFTGVV